MKKRVVHEDDIVLDGRTIIEAARFLTKFADGLTDPDAYLVLYGDVAVHYLAEETDEEYSARRLREMIKETQSRDSRYQQFLKLQQEFGEPK